MTIADVKARLTSGEITDWKAYYQVESWLHKADTSDVKKAMAFATEVHEILVGRGE